jgi:hypothetical protein
LIERLPAGALCVGAPDPSRRRPPDRPAAVMVLAPVLGLAIWAGVLALLF